MFIPTMPPRDDRPAGEKGFVSLRDHFAMAALTGLLSNVQRYQNGPLTEQAFEIADFMLRERGRKNHDAVPAAIARTDADRNRTDKAALRPGKGAGNTQEMQPTLGECSKPSEGT